jgi:hypothetical protein
VKAVQEQQEMIQALRDEIRDLRAMVRGR